MAAALPVAAAGASIFSNPAVLSALISALGGVAGAGIGAFGGGSAKPKIKKIETMNPQQKKLFQDLLSQLSGGGQAGGPGGGALDLLQQYLNPESDVYKNFEAPYKQQFEQETIPNLAERFAGLGGGLGAAGGALGSSGFAQALGGAGAKLQTDLASMKSGLQHKSIQDILGLLQNMLQIAPHGYVAT